MGAAVFLAAGCGLLSHRDTADPNGTAAKNRVLYETAIRMSVSREGIRVCRFVAVGIGQGNLIVGRVAEVDQGRIRVQIENPGRIPQTLNGVSIIKGATFWESSSAWTLCT